MSEAGLVVCGILVIPIIAFIVFGFHSLHATEWGLDYNMITESIHDEPYESGLHFLGLGHKFIKFPNTYQNMQFSSSDHDLLQCRTADGLPLTLGVSFQYTLEKDHIYELYRTYKTDYHAVLFDVASSNIAETASRYTAYNFFNDKQSIAMAMSKNLNKAIIDYMYLSVETLQLVKVQLPDEFENAIMDSINMKQNITQTQKKLANLLVSFQTQILAAHQSANQTVTLAQGQAKQIKFSQEGAAKVIRQNIDAEALAYSRMKQHMQMNNQELLDYIWYDMMTSKQSDAQIVVGMNPNTFIQQNGVGAAAETATNSKVHMDQKP